jgi:hypothetical protein
MAGFSFVPRWPVMGSRLQKMSGVFSSSFRSMPVDCSSFSGMPGIAGVQTGARVSRVTTLIADAGQESSRQAGLTS